MLEFIPFFIVLIAGLFFSELFLRFHLPWVIALILGGIIIGPSGFGVFETNTAVSFFAEIGLIFLMFMAGLESNLLGKKRPREGYEKIVKISLLNTVIPFVVGMIVALSLGYSSIVAFLMGTVFASTSVAVLLPSLESIKLLRCGLGRTMINVGILNDVISLTLLSIALNSISTTSSLSVMTFMILFLVVIWILRALVPKVIWFFQQDIKSEKDLFQQELRTILFILIGIVILFELIGLDPIISGFFAGLFVAQSATSKIIREKIRTIGYGVFIPIFFVTVGASVNIFSGGILTQTIFTAIGLSIILIIIKFASGYLSAINNGFNAVESRILASSTVSQMSVPLAVATTGMREGFIDGALFSVLVLLTVITTLVSPVLMQVFSRRYIRREVEFQEY